MRRYAKCRFCDLQMSAQRWLTHQDPNVHMKVCNKCLEVLKTKHCRNKSINCHRDGVVNCKNCINTNEHYFKKMFKLIELE